MEKTVIEFPQLHHINSIETSEWESQFSEHIIWLSQKGMNNAVIKIHPEDLGPIEISIDVINKSTSLHISSHSQYVRELIEQSLSKLQEMMIEHGLNLSEVTVDSNPNSRREQQNHHFKEELTSSFEEETISTPTKNKDISQGVIDYFA